MIGILALFIYLGIFIYAGLMIILSAVVCGVLYFLIKFIMGLMNKLHGGYHK